jgi:hypothetical protein
MDFRGLSNDGRAMPIAVNKLDRAELRQQRRYIAPFFEIIVECELFHSVDVSVGGVKLDGVCEGLPIGTPVEGWIALSGLTPAFAFSGEILRTDDATGNTIVRFDEIEPEAEEFLDRSVAWRLY